MTWFDLLLLAILFLSIGFATIRGAIREIATLAALGGGALLAWLAFNPLLGALGLKGSFFGMVGLAGGLMAIFFVAVYAAFHFGLQRLSLDPPMQRVDRIVGGVFGLLRGLALIGLGYLGYAYNLDENQRPDAVTNAFMLPVAQSAAGFFESLAPQYDSQEVISPDKIGDSSAPDKSTLNTEDPTSKINAANDGYKRGERAALSEIITTSTTNSAAVGATVTASNQAEDDPIAAILDTNGNSETAGPKLNDK